MGLGECDGGKELRWPLLAKLAGCVKDLVYKHLTCSVTNRDIHRGWLGWPPPKVQGQEGTKIMLLYSGLEWLGEKVANGRRHRGRQRNQRGRRREGRVDPNFRPPA